MANDKGTVSLQELEHAINYWRQQEEQTGLTLGPTVRHLATPYGLMIYQKRDTVAVAALDPRAVIAIQTAKEKSHV